jgi:hypothetical protein
MCLANSHALGGFACVGEYRQQTYRTVWETWTEFLLEMGKSGGRIRDGHRRPWEQVGKRNLGNFESRAELDL